MILLMDNLNSQTARFVDFNLTPAYEFLLPWR
jgi:hypothetical protein